MCTWRLRDGLIVAKITSRLHFLGYNESLPQSSCTCPAYFTLFLPEGKFYVLYISLIVFKFASLIEKWSCDISSFLCSNAIYERTCKLKSHFFPCLQTSEILFVFVGLMEAQDIALHLSPLRNILEDLEQADFENCDRHFAPLMHTVCLIWSLCKHYQIPGRIVVLLQEVCNLLIDLSHSFLSPEEILKVSVTFCFCVILTIKK